MSSESQIDLFGDAAAGEKLRTMDGDVRDELGFGVVEVSGEGVVKAYNHWEAKLSGLAAESVLGRNFFTDIAPCTNNYMFAEKLLAGGDGLDETFDYVFTFKMKPTKVAIRLLKSKETAFILVRLRT